MEPLQVKRIIEGLLFVAGEPVSLKRIQEVVAPYQLPGSRKAVPSADRRVEDESAGSQDRQIGTGPAAPSGHAERGEAGGDVASSGADLRTLRQLITQLNDEYVQTQRAFRIQEIANGFQLVTDPELAPWMKRALALPREDLLSKAALETLAIVAYRQPLTKAEVEVIRGVDVTATLDTLLERQFARVVGRKDTPGRPLLYGTTTEFLRHFGLKSLEDLPPMTTGSGVPALPQAKPEAGAGADVASTETVTASPQASSESAQQQDLR